MTSDPKEALERLKARAAKEELAAGNVQGPNCRGTEWGADIIAAHRQHAADLSWLIAEREGLEREVGAVRGLNNILSEKLERRTLALEAAESKLSALEAELERAHFVLRAVRLSEIDDTDRQWASGAAKAIFGNDGTADPNDLQAVAERVALLHPTVPVERGNAAEVLQRIETGELDVAPPSQGMETRMQALEKCLSLATYCLLPLQMTLAEREMVGDPVPANTVVLDFMGSGASAVTRASDLAELATLLAALQSHKGSEGDSELAAADNNHTGRCITKIRGVEPSSDASVSASPAADVEVVAALLAEDEEFGADASGRALNLGWGLRLVRAGKDQEHSGDCDNKPWTCLRCQRDDYMTRATIFQATLAAGQSLNGLAQDGSSPQNDEAHHPADNNHKADCTTSGGAG